MNGELPENLQDRARVFGNSKKKEKGEKVKKYIWIVLLFITFSLLITTTHAPEEEIFGLFAFHLLGIWNSWAFAHDHYMIGIPPGGGMSKRDSKESRFVLFLCSVVLHVLFSYVWVYLYF